MHNFRLLLIVGVSQLTQHFLDHILQGHQTSRAAKFIHHNGDRGPALLEILQQRNNPLALRHEKGGPAEALKIDIGPRSVHIRQHILSVKDAAHVVDAALINGNFGHLAVSYDLQGLIHTRLGFQR